MANQEQLEMLRQGVKAWNAWRHEHPNVEVDLQQANLRGANLSGAILSGAFLSGANLDGANLEAANLEAANLGWAILSGSKLDGANLSGAFLRWANFDEAGLRRADLSGADLIEANLTRAILFGANLSGAILSGTNLSGAFLSGANMRVAIFGGTIVGDVDLRTVEGLDMVLHLRPSTIGLDTIEMSKGQIPAVFLRGAGVSDRIIDYIPSLTAQAIDFYSCFISYSHADTSFARRLHDALQGRGIRCWLDEHQLLPGHSIYDEIDRGIRLWDKILLCASESSLKSWWVDNEIDKAFEKEQQLMQQRGMKIRALIPLNLDNALWQWQDGKANQVRSRLAADFTGWEHDNAKFEREFERLVKALRTDEGREEPPKPKL